MSASGKGLHEGTAAIGRPASYGERGLTLEEMAARADLHSRD